MPSSDGPNARSRSMVAAKSAVYYLAKYFKKDSCTPKDLLILYHKAKILQERYPSTASDTDTDTIYTGRINHRSKVKIKNKSS